jgi:regulator of protease activity HflC (stomatin/prohibitin superfamily)
MVLAKSLHFSDVYPFVINDQETSDGVRGDLAYTITLQTTNAAETLKYKNWIRKVNPSVEGTSKDFVLGNTLKEMLAIKNELSADPDSFVRAMKSLNDDSIGNISLHKQVGQRITAANLTAVGFEDEVAKALEAQQVAERQGDARVSAAKKDADTKVEEARGMDAITLALDRRAAALAKPGGNLVASIENTKAIAEATKEHEGTVVWGGQVLPTTPV